MNLEVVIARYAADRFGVVTREELRTLGASDAQIERRMAAGLLVPVHPGVYRHAASPLTFEATARAAVLGAGGLAAASGSAAMRLYGVRGVWDDEPEITVVGSALPDLAGVRIRRIDRLDPADVERRFGIPVLAPPMALLLLGAVEHPGRVENAAHDMVFQRLTTRARLLDALARYGGRGRRGTRALRAAIASLPAHGATQTRLELDLVRLVRAHDLPEPELQHPAIGSDGVVRHLDLAWPEHLVDAETDGDRWHLSPADRASDRRRDAALQALGWTVHRFGSHDVHERPERTVAALRSSLSAGQRLALASGQRTTA